MQTHSRRKDKDRLPCWGDFHVIAVFTALIYINAWGLPPHASAACICWGCFDATLVLLGHSLRSKVSTA